MNVEDMLEEANTLNSDGAISEQDMFDYFEVVFSAFDVHLDRERIRKGLWKKYNALDQVHPVRVKTDRIMRSLEGTPTQEQIDNAVEELYDIINYANFAVRILQHKV